MALDKQKILNELGSVVNQLQGADCGCMGKIFSNCTHQSNSGNPQSHGGGCGSCGHHCHGHHQQGWGQNAPCGGEPHSNQPCMTACNPQKLYADTYKYLNHNLMQPVLREVYNDLKTITPANTISNNPMATKLGLAGNASSDMTGNMGHNQMAGGEMNNTMTYNQMNNDEMGNMQHNQMSSGMSNMPQNQITSGMNNMTPHNQMTGGAMSHNIPQHQMTNDGMGNMVYNQMAGNGMSYNMPQNQLTSGGMSNMPQNQMTSGMNNMSYNQTTAGGMSNMPQNQMTSGGHNMSYNQTAAVGMSNMPQNQMTSGGNNMSYKQTTAGGMSNITPQNQMHGSSGEGMYGHGNMSQSMNPNQQMGSMGAPPMHQQMAPHHNNQQKHGQGVGMFNAMFPGVMQGLGGDLDFDPMSIAVQMNPSNQQRAALDSMNKMMMGNKEGIGKILHETGNSAAMQPAIKGANAAAAVLSQDQYANMQQNATAYQAAPMQQNAPASFQPMQQNAPIGYQQMQQNAPTGYQQMQQNAPTGYQQMTPTHDVGLAYQTSRQQLSGTMGEAPPQQVYAAYTGTPKMNQQEMPKDMHQPQYQQMDPNAGSVPAYGGSGDPNTQTVQYNQQQLKEPIFPAESNRQLYYSAQQVKHIPGRMYQAPEQASHAQRVPTRTHDPTAYSNVKSTVSKTSLMGFKRSGNVPSRSQLQHIYNQYKGSQSYTQQNVRPSDRTTHSAGSLSVSHPRLVPAPVPLERLGGDTINNQTNNNFVNKVDHVIGRMGDVPANNKPLDNFPKEEAPTRQSRCRNGLQDVVFTSYPTSAAWSFHGNRFKA